MWCVSQVRRWWSEEPVLYKLRNHREFLGQQQKQGPSLGCSQQETRTSTHCEASSLASLKGTFQQISTLNVIIVTLWVLTLRSLPLKQGLSAKPPVLYTSCSFLNTFFHTKLHCFCCLSATIVRSDHSGSRTISNMYNVLLNVYWCSFSNVSLEDGTSAKVSVTCKQTGLCRWLCRVMRSAWM